MKSHNILRGPEEVKLIVMVIQIIKAWSLRSAQILATGHKCRPKAGGGMALLGTLLGLSSVIV